MPDLGYLIAAVAVGAVITIALRALPFAILKPLRRSKFVTALGRWMPAGILFILAVVILRDELAARPSHWWAVLVATAVTIVVHLVGRRRAVLSVAAGTACYIVLLNLV
ncbi:MULTISPECIES: branched-chain amino acid transporter permease [Leucobacter]|uniref:Branched-chain amino acid exporter BrnE n=2 Tax=Leucobacter TaxID=55968 RepID=A0ABN3B3N4_9MICO|nr:MULTISPECIES: AzlD domain-containing protein [Leucobacter]MBS3180806.1 AzlD domain-containing protein [Leucobacter manosquensis]